MRGKWATIYAVTCTLALAFCLLGVFAMAWHIGTLATVQSLIGMAIGFIFAPICHELGHVVFAKSADMSCVYVKFFCFRIYEKEGKRRFGFASPFAPDETQVIPRSGGDMQKRAKRYAIGGLVLEGSFFLVMLISAILLSGMGRTQYLLWGMLPYMGYLFLLNVVPAEYASGKTDGGIVKGIKKGYDAEKCWLSAMEIQGQLYAGRSFSEIEERYYFDLPQLCEDEPLFAVMLDLRYRYFLEKGDLEKAADCLNRLAQVQAYLPQQEVTKIAAELVYMHALRGDFENAEASGKLCREYLQSNTASAKRILIAYSKAFEKTDAVEILTEQAKACLTTEKILGMKKFEEILISRSLSA